MSQSATQARIGTVVVAGGTGFIGHELTGRLQRDGYEVVVLTRSLSRSGEAMPHTRFVVWDGKSTGEWETALEGSIAVVNLAGESIGARRWSAQQKERIVSSRLDATTAIVSAIGRLHKRPSVLVNGSAIGYYGDTGDREITEDSEKGEGFLADTVDQWEAAARRVDPFGVRLVLIRNGVVLGKKATALGRMVLPFRFFLGGPLGSGRQWFPWVHIDDVIECILFAIRSEDISEAYNVVATVPVTMKRFSEILGRVLRRPSWLPVPSLALRLLLGEMSGMILGGQRAVPGRLTRAGFQFRYRNVREALAAILA